MIIPEHEINARSFSHANAYDRLFEWRDGFYRGIRGERADLFRDLFRKGLFERLTRDHGLIDTEMTEYRTEAFPLVLRHRRLPVISYCFEWSGRMLQESALCTLRLERALRAEGLTLQDAHPWNVVFEGTRPVFVDLGSIKPMQAEWHAYFVNELTVMQYYPLALMERGLYHAARCLMRAKEGVSRQEYLLLCRKLVYAPYRLQRLWKRLAAGRRGSRNTGRIREAAMERKVQRLERSIERMRFQPLSTLWARYADESYPSLDDPGKWLQKQRTVCDVLERLRPASVTDLGANRGWYSRMAARLGARVIAIDTDDTCVNDLFDTAFRAGESIHPVVMNLAHPTPAEGVGGTAYPAAADRFQSELVMANALMHHLVFTVRFDFRQVVDLLSSFSSRWLLVEFMDRDYKYVAQWLRPHHGWYTRENFETALRRKFKSLTMLPSNAKDRVFFLCEDRV